MNKQGKDKIKLFVNLDIFCNQLCTALDLRNLVTWCIGTVLIGSVCGLVQPYFEFKYSWKS